MRLQAGVSWVVTMTYEQEIIIKCAIKGTLGGLARQAEPDLFEPLFLNALSSIDWCSSDPLCLNGISSASESFNLAACHACLLVPETSCEHYNRYLDRAMLRGSELEGVSGYFDGLMTQGAYRSQ